MEQQRPEHDGAMVFLPLNRFSVSWFINSRSNKRLANSARMPPNKVSMCGGVMTVVSMPNCACQ